MEILGTEFKLILKNCGIESIDDKRNIIEILKEAAEIAKVTIVKVCDYEFKPQGLTVSTIISESHISIHIHTWPEIRKTIVISFDTCSDAGKGKDAVLYLVKQLNPVNHRCLEIGYGYDSHNEPSFSAIKEYKFEI